AAETAHIASLVVSLLALDNLMLVHSRLGTLDMLALAPILVAAWLALRERWVRACALLGLGCLVKITALFGLLAVLLLLAARVAQAVRTEPETARDALRGGAVVVIACGVVAIAGRWVLYAVFTTVAPQLDHVAHMLQYGSSLTASADRGGNCTGISSSPWQ